MIKSQNYQDWIDTGYELFARQGLESMQIERLARILDLNKSGFYHYFGDLNNYFEHLIRHHHHRIDQMVKEIESIEVLDPDYLLLMLKHNVTVMANMQLLRNRHKRLFENAFSEASHKIDSALVPVWSAHLGIPDQPELALSYLKMARDVFYARVTFDSFNYEFLHNLALDAKRILDDMVMHKQLSSQVQQVKAEFFSFISGAS